MPALFLALSLSSIVMAWLSESPPNLSEPRIKIMPGFPRDGDLPKPLAAVLPPFVVTLPITVQLYHYFVLRAVDRFERDMDFVHQLVGWIIVFLSHLLMRSVRRHCGRFYTFDRSIKQKHELITTGPYSYVQNPGYLSMIGTTAGIWLFTNFSYVNVLPTIVICTVLTGIPTEERMLREEFGREYDDFQKTRYRLIPLIW